VDRTTSWEMPGEPARPLPPADPVGTRTSSTGRWIVAALVGAVVGALVSVGALLTFGDVGAGTTATRPPASRPSLALGGETLDIGAILERVEPAVVSISTRGFARDDFLRVVPSGGSGTGMILSPDGDVLTNAHVVAAASRIEAKLSDGRTLGATLVGADPSADVALIRLQNARDLPTVTLGRSADLQVGDGVVAIGNALALPGGPTVTSGIVSADRKSVV
jgi:S1-C subfamily serine protease